MPQNFSLAKLKNSKSNINIRSNSVNSKEKFYNEQEEYVLKLNLFNPKNASSSQIFNKSFKNNLEISKNILKSRASMLVNNETNDETNAVLPETRSQLNIRKNINKNSIIDLKKLKVNSVSSQIKSKIKEIELKTVIARNISMKKLHYQSRENNLEQKRKDLSTEINSLRIEKNIIINTLNGLVRDNNKIVVDLEYYEEVSKNEDNIRIELIKNSSKNEKNFELLNQMLLDFESQTEKKREKVNKDRKILEENKTKLLNLREKLSNIKSRIDACKEELNEMNCQLIKHYHEILQEGNDTRKEGLIWIFKAIWNLGSEIIISCIPSFLDEKAIEYLFIAGKKSVDIEKLGNQIDELKKQTKIDMDHHKFIQVEMTRTRTKYNKSFITTSEKELPFKKTKKLNSSLVELKDNYQKENKNTKYSFHNISQFLKQNEKLEVESFELIKKLKDLEINYEKGKSELQILKRTELDRLAKEFLVNDYARRFNTTQKDVIAAIAGDNELNLELIRQNRETKVDYINF
jgi:hypothetical protein